LAQYFAGGFLFSRFSATLLHNSFSYLDPDFGWHMKTGELIWQTRAVPDLNLNDYTLAGTHWLITNGWRIFLFI